MIPTPTAEAAVIGSSVIQGQDQSQQGLFLAKSSPVGLGSMAKSQVSSKKPSTTPTNGSDSVLRATAVAAGARIASPSDVASFIKATQAKNAVHIKPTAGYSGKSPVPSGVSTHSQTQTAVTITPTASNPGSVKAASPTVQHASSATSSNVLSEQPIAVIPILPNELQSKQGVKTAEEIEVRESGYPPQEQVKEEGVCVSGNAQTEQVQGDKAPSPDKKAEFRKQTTDAKSPVSSLSAESDHKAMIDNQAEARQSTNDKEMVENQDTNKEQADLPSMIVDECGEKLEVSIKTETGNEIEGPTKVK